jgi:hypothetical protein
MIWEVSIVGDALLLLTGEGFSSRTVRFQRRFSVYARCPSVTRLGGFRGAGSADAVRIPPTDIAPHQKRERGRMTDTNDGRFSELFEVIQDYAGREYHYQDKALQVIAGSYVFMFESEDMPDARPVIDTILEQYDDVYTTLERGNLDALIVDAIVKVALYREEHMEWGLNRLGRILEGLFRRSRTDESYEDYVEDASIVIRGLQRIVSGSVLEEFVEASNGG